MTEDDRKFVADFESRVRQLMMEYQALNAENDRLNDTLKSKDQTIQQLKEKNEQLASDYESLKMAKMIQISDSEMEDAQKRITKLVREIDRCISLIDV